MTPLRRRMADDMQVRHLSPCTQDTYIRQVSLFAATSASPRSCSVPSSSAHTRSISPPETASLPARSPWPSPRYLYRVTLQKDWNIEVPAFSRTLETWVVTGGAAF